MKVIKLEEAKANLEQYASECQSSPVVVTVERDRASRLAVVSVDPGATRVPSG